MQEVTAAARHTVTVDGVQYFALPDYQQLAPLVPKPTSRVRDGSEASLLDQARDALSDSNWEVGRVAAYWMKHHARGRQDSDLGSFLGLSPDQVYQRRRVWEAFSDVRESYPQLIWSHFYAALNWDDAAECLKWANEVQAGVAEMRAWRRAQNGMDLTGEDE